MNQLTEGQEYVLNFLKDFFLSHGYHASYRQIMKGLGYSSISSVQNALNGLEAKGKIRRRGARAIQLVGYRVELHPE